jgi:O-antigen/teichoic acid export membrane protein
MDAIAHDDKKGLLDRLLRGVAANALGKVYVALLQLISVPALVGAWGADGYGVWVMLATIPTYLALSDFGFSQAATADMTMQIARGERERANATFQSLWILVLSVGAAIIAAAAMILLAATYVLHAPSWLAEHADVLCALTVYAVIAQASRTILTGFHASGQYALGTGVYDALVFSEGLLVIAAALAGGGYFACALVLMCARGLTACLLKLILRKRVPWLRLGLRHASRGELERLWRPAIAAMAIPLSMALNIQGMVLVVGTVLSPAAAATFSAVRTISRVAVQMVGIFGRASMPELSAAVALDKSNRVASILRMNLAVLVLVLVPGAAVFALYGVDIVRLWTGGGIVPDAGFVALMAAGLVVHAIWMLATQMLLAVNRHGRAATLALVVSIATVLAAIPAAQAFGLEGVAVVLLVGDAVLATLGIISYSTVLGGLGRVRASIG